jgi:hypothetical protein
MSSSVDNNSNTLYLNVTNVILKTAGATTAGATTAAATTAGATTAAATTAAATTAAVPNKPISISKDEIKRLLKDIG